MQIINEWVCKLLYFNNCRIYFKDFIDKHLTRTLYLKLFIKYFYNWKSTWLEIGTPIGVTESIYQWGKKT